MKHLILGLSALTSLAPAIMAATVSGNSSTWTSLAGTYDYLADQQTGQPAGDIVGTGTNYGLLVTFNDNGSASRTDGTLGFRLRLDAAGGATNKPAFDRAAWIGIDADLNGSVDVFLGLNLSGSATDLGIYAPGTGANTSPNTTSISSTAFKSYTIDSSNYNYRLVDYTLDGGTTNDVTTTTTGDPDYYVSFMVSFSDVVAFLNTKSISITDQSSIRYVSATSTQANSLNQDLGGVNGGINSTSTWTALGGFSPTVNASGTAVPEPGSCLLVLLSVVAGVLPRKRP